MKRKINHLRVLLKLGLFGVLVTFAGTAKASDLQYVRITDNSDNQIYLLLADQPKVTTDNEGITVTSGEDTFIFPYASNATFDFKKTSALTKLDKGDLMISYLNHILTVEGLDPESAIDAYSVSGTHVISGRSDINGCWNVETTGWEKGVYIVKTGKLTYKIIVR